METPLIIIEWIDGVGKTTLAKWLAQKIGGEYYKTPGCRTSEERALFDRVWISVLDRFNFYLEACREDLQRIDKMRKEWKIIFCDRFVGSTVVHHQAMKPDINIESAEKLEKNIRKKVEILLVAQRESIIQRLSDRQSQTQFEADENLFIRTQKRFIERGADLIIDTTNLDTDETLMRALNFLQK